MSLSDRLFCNHHAHPLCQAWSYRLRCAKELFVWFKSRLNPWYISIPSNLNLYSTKLLWKCDGKQLQAVSQCALSAPLPPHYTNSLWLCSSVHCGPPHQSRRIWCRQPKTFRHSRRMGNPQFCLSGKMPMKNRWVDLPTSPEHCLFNGYVAIYMLCDMLYVNSCIRAITEESAWWLLMYRASIH